MVRYTSTATWEEFANGYLTETTVTKRIALETLPQNGCVHVTLRTESVALSGSQDPPPFSQFIQRLAVLYEELVLEVSRSGEPIALLNHPSILDKWQTVKEQLRDEQHEEDAVTEALLEQVDAQVQTPAQVLLSLRHDYMYRTLLHITGRPLFPASQVSPQPVEFSQFFEDSSLWFTERMEVIPSSVPHTTLAFRGALHEQATDMKTVRQHMQAASRPTSSKAAPCPAAPDIVPTALSGGYEASYELEVATGTPAAAYLSVYCRLADQYNKQYSLTLQRV